jgi:hypothetical protein
MARRRWLRRFGWLLAVLGLLAAAQVWRWGRPLAPEYVVTPAAPGEWRINPASRDSGAEVWRAFDDTGDGTMDRFATPAGEWLRPGLAGEPRRWLVICIDAAPFEVMAGLWDRGHFREFHRPSAAVSPFPSDSETAITEALHSEPVPGYEHQYFDRAANELRGGLRSTLTRRQDAARIPYLDRFDYAAPGWHRAVQYVVVRKAWHAEMNRLRRLLRENRADVFHAHVSSGDPIFHMLTREEFEPLLLEFEAVVREAYLEARGELGVVLWSDHGNSLALSRAVPLDELLGARGWRRRSSLEAPRDVVIPAYGLVGFFAVYTREENVAELARDLTTLEGADFVVHRLAKGEDGAVILGADGSRALLRWSNDGARYRYERVTGDPLGLAPVFAALAEEGKLDDGWARDADLFAATSLAWYPDAAARIRGWATNHVQNPSDLIVSLKPGWYQGKSFFDFAVTMRGTHGAMERTSSLGFAAATQPLPPALRLADLLPEELR